MSILRWAFALGVCAAASAQAQPASFTVATASIADQKAVFATVEAAHVVPARARIGGTLTSYEVKYGDSVQAGQRIAMIADPAMIQQLQTLDAGIAAARAQLAQANIDFARAQKLILTGAVSRAVYDQAQTGVSVATSTLKAKRAERDTLAQQINEGAVYAPVAGRVLLTPLTQGTVVQAGDSVASIAEQDYVLRLDVPEHHIDYLHVGDMVRVAGDKPLFAKIVLVYPQVANGRVEADAIAPDVGDYFVGQRIEVWVYVGSRPGVVVPASFIDTRFGLDYADLRAPDGHAIAVPVQRGMPQPTPELPDGVEILSGLKTGDVLLPPGSAP
ncbi:efflux RND transporter periplasmic adaptor subunit [Acidocella aromatica]|uniref:RND family efflux transporter MFP subunit n=1 Tax=Acidocella aromatica TaxID=1303579 RepID=A0A840VC78_9PROT|nr:efflux RND transporter periplasmic adaptor subunit [Acidocella aromatica]MBB5373403.1 RND family efflux transporter MFP subunit [Acidocella aromatica]